MNTKRLGTVFALLLSMLIVPTLAPAQSTLTPPVFLGVIIGAHGGFDTLGLYTLTLLGSEDVSHYIVSLYPRDPAYLAALDYGHGDLFNAKNAKDVVWSKILRWLKDHEGDNTGSQ